MRNSFITIISVMILVATVAMLSCKPGGGGPTTPSNNAPVIESIESTTSLLLPENIAVLTCTASDVEEDSLSYQWSADGGSFPNGNTDSIVVWEAPSDTGVYLITVEVSDEISTTTGYLPIGVALTGTFEIALFDTTFSVTDIIDYTTDPPPNDSVGCWVSEGLENYTLNYGGSIERTYNQDSLYLDAINLVPQLGDMTSTPYEFSLDQSFYNADISSGLTPGNYSSIDPFEFGPDTITIDLSSEFEWVVLESGSTGDTNHVNLTVRNNLSFPVENLDVRIVMHGSNLVLVDTEFEDELIPGESNNVSILLPTEETIDGTGSLIISGYSGGSNSSVIIEETDQLEFDLDFGILDFSSISMHVLSQTIDSIFYFEVASDDEIVEAVIQEAIADFSFFNDTELYVIFTYTIPDFVDQYGTVFGNTMLVAQGETYDSTGIDISGYTLTTDANQILMSMVINIIDSYNVPFYPAGGMIEINSDDDIEMNFDFYNPDEPDGAISLSHFEGSVASQTFEIDPFSYEFENVPSGLIYTDFADADLKLDIWSTFGVELPVEFELTGHKSGSQVAAGTANVTLQAGTLSSPMLSTFNIDGFENVIGAVPDELVMTGRYHLGGPIEVDAENYNGAYFEGNYLLSAPFSLTFNMDSVSTMTELTGFSWGNGDLLTGAELTASIENHMPCAGVINIVGWIPVGPNSGIDTLLQIEIPPPVLDGNSFVSEPGTSVDTYSLSAESIEFLSLASTSSPMGIYSIIDFNSGGEVVNIAPDDYFMIACSMSLTLGN